MDTKKIALLVLFVSLASVSNGVKLTRAIPPLITENAPITSTNNDLRQGFLEWIASILRPPTTTTTTTTTPHPSTTTPRECPDCQCGIANIVKRIVGGVETEERRYPWMALLLRNNNYYCGGSLINDLYVVTAAHCLLEVLTSSISVRLLEHNRTETTNHSIERRAASVLINENYNPRTYDNDIGLIRLSEPVKFSDTLRPICLPARNNTFAGELAVVTGWGTLTQGGHTSPTLQQVDVPIWSQEACRDSNYDASSITDNMLCAGYDEGGKDSCQGDSGGPLHVRADKNNSTEYQLAGIVSWGEGCAQPDTPGVYTRVNLYNDWIIRYTSDGCTCRSSAEHN